MKKNVLALSIAAMIGGLGFAGAASAAPATSLTVADSGTGHMLLVPYYTAQNGNMSVFHVVNTDTVNGKAVKVRFRGASNSDDVLDFQVFMSPGDVWTAAVTQGADGVANLVTADGTCTLPAISKGVAVPFVQDRLPSSMSAADKAANTREGYVEIFNMADISSSAATGNDPANPGTVANYPLYKAIKHVNGVAPCTDTVLQGTLNYTAGVNGNGLLDPTDGLTGSWYIINVPQTTTFSASANAIVAVDGTGVAGTGKNVFSPQSTGGATLFTADPLMKAGVLAPQKYDVPDLSTPYLVAQSQAAADAQATALTAALAAKTVINQYANDASITAKTDWVFSMPTRRYSIAANYGATISATKVGYTGAAVSGATALAADSYRVINGDVVSYFTAQATNTAVNTIGQICVNAKGQTFYDREETSKQSGAVFSPGALSKTQLCGEVSVLSFADSGASVLGAAVARTNVTGVYTNGWGQIDFTAGVPVLGASFIKLTNPQATAGVSGNYGITWPHAYRK